MDIRLNVRAAMPAGMVEILQDSVRGRRFTTDEILDSQPISFWQLLTIFLCFCVVTFDGLDLAIMGFLAPSIRAVWHLNPHNLAWLFSGALAGLSVGALCAGPLADAVGRKYVIMVAVGIFGSMCLASAFSSSFHVLLLFRVLTGAGLGAAVPNAITLTSEYTPARKRAFSVTAMFCGFTLGSAAGGTLLVPLLLPHVGWRGVFAFTGALSLLLVPFLAFCLPESLKYLMHRGADGETLHKLVRKVFPGFPIDNQTILLAEDPESQSPLRQLFMGRLRSITLLLWVSYFFSLLIVYLFTNWMPIVMTDTGLSVSTATIVVGMFQVGGTLGAPVLGYLIDRRRPENVLAVAYVLGALAIAGLSLVFPLRLGTVICTFIAGIGISASITGLNALSSEIYPTSSRATGVGWGLGIGRLGSILGSAAGAWLFSKLFTIQTSFLLVSIPALLIAFSIGWLGRLRCAPQPATGTEEA